MGPLVRAPPAPPLTFSLTRDLSPRLTLTLSLAQTLSQSQTLTLTLTRYAAHEGACPVDRPKTAFARFHEAYKAELVAAAVGGGDIGAAVEWSGPFDEFHSGASHEFQLRWHALSPAEREGYEADARADKARLGREMAGRYLGDTVHMHIPCTCTRTQYAHAHAHARAHNVHMHMQHSTLSAYKPSTYYLLLTTNY